MRRGEAIGRGDDSLQNCKTRIRINVGMSQRFKVEVPVGPVGYVLGLSVFLFKVHRLVRKFFVVIKEDELDC